MTPDIGDEVYSPSYVEPPTRAQLEAELTALRATLASALNEAEEYRRELAAFKEYSLQTQMNGYKWMERHDRIAAGKDGGPYPSPVDVPNAIAELTAARDRIAAMEGALADLLSWFPDKPSPPEWRFPAGEYGADEAVAAARELASGKEQP